MCRYSHILFWFGLRVEIETGKKLLLCERNDLKYLLSGLEDCGAVYWNCGNNFEFYFVFD